MASRPGGMPQQGGGSVAPTGLAPPPMSPGVGPNMFAGAGGPQAGPPPMPTPQPGPAVGMQMPQMPQMPPQGGGFMQTLMGQLPPQLAQNPQFMHLMQMLGGGLGGGQVPGGGGGLPPGLSM